MDDSSRASDVDRGCEGAKGRVSSVGLRDLGDEYGGGWLVGWFGL